MDIILQKLGDYSPWHMVNMMIWQIPSIKTEIGLSKFPNNISLEAIRFRYNELIPQHEIIFTDRSKSEKY